MLTALLLATVAAPDTLPGEMILRTALAAAHQFAAANDEVIRDAEHVVVVTERIGTRLSAAGIRSDSAEDWLRLVNAVSPKGAPMRSGVTCTGPWGCPSIEVRQVKQAATGNGWEASVHVSYCLKAATANTAVRNARTLQCTAREILMTLRPQNGALVAERARWGGAA